MNDLHLTPMPYPLPEGKGEALLVSFYRGEPDFLYHYHPQYELTLTMGSAGRRLVGGNVAHYAWKDFVLLGPNLPHTWAAEPHPNHGLGAQNSVIHFTRESVGLDFLSRSELRTIAGLLDRAARGLVFSGAGADEAGLLVQSIRQLHGARRMITFLSILQLLAEKATGSPILTAARSPFDLERDYTTLAGVIDYIHRRSQFPICLSDVAIPAGMSVPTFCRFFRRATGTSFVDYLNDWRISQACALLAGTTYSVLEISQRTGFNNLSHFNRQFLRRRGVSPREFRVRANRNKEVEADGR